MCCSFFSIEQDEVVMTGRWWNGGEGDDAEIRLERAHPPEHVMLSYQWGSQQLVKRVAAFFKSKKLLVWLDVDGGMKGNINQAMANGVEGACVVCSFATPAYARSPNCNKEINYAFQLKKRIVLVNVGGAMDYNANGALMSKVAGAVDDKYKVVLSQPSSGEGGGVVEERDDDKSFSTTLEGLYEVVSGVVAEEEAKKALAKSATTSTTVAPPPDIYQRGHAAGNFMDDSSGTVASYDIFLYNISMRKGLVSGYSQGEATGMITITGSYDNGNNVSFQMEFERTYNIPTRYFKGSCVRKGGNGFCISGLCSLEEGKFDDDRLTFTLESPDEEGV